VVRAPYHLPAPVQRAVAAIDGNRIVIAGGLDAAGSSTGGVFALTPANGHLRALGSVPQVFHDAAGALLGKSLFVFGGGVSTTTDAVQAFDLSTGQGRVAGRLPTPLSDLASATVDGREQPLLVFVDPFERRDGMSRHRLRRRRARRPRMSVDENETGAALALRIAAVLGRFHAAARPERLQERLAPPRVDADRGPVQKEGNLRHERPPSVSTCRSAPQCGLSQVRKAAAWRAAAEMLSIAN
jgi:hypothetical protein